MGRPRRANFGQGRVKSKHIISYQSFLFNVIKQARKRPKISPSKYKAPNY